MRAHAFTELVPPPRRGRVFTSGARAGLADCAPSGRIRLDALARWLQDIAYDDVEDAGVAGAAVWVVRRTRIKVARFPRFGERFSLKTFCSGFGRAWAERRTTIAARRPAPLTAEEIDVYGEAAAGRKVTARLRHETPDGASEARRWTFRATECDVAGHVNNAAYWQPLEEELLDGGEPHEIDVEMEFRNAAQPGQKLVLGDGARRWIVGGDGDVHASVVMSRPRD